MTNKLTDQYISDLDSELSTGRMDPRVGSGRVGSGRVGSGRAGSGHDFARFWRVG